MSAPAPLDRAKGIVPALPTPYAADGAPDLRVLAALTRDLLDAGVDGFYVGGSTGDGIMQTHDERVACIAAVAAECGGQVPVIAHVGTPDTASTIRLAEAAADAGASAVSAIAPPIPLERAELLGYFTTVADAAPVPFIPYYFPKRSGVEFDLAFLAEMVAPASVAGVKFTSLDLYTLNRLTRLRGGSLIVWNGHDEVLLGGLVAGAAGAIGSTFGVAPGLYTELLRAYRAGDLSTARALQGRVTDLVAALVGVGVMPGLRELLRLSGYAMGEPRPPHRGLGAPQREQVADLWRALRA
ncbi:dihydrodipicolinate synthase family protein [Naumannella huperziae]